MYIICSDSPHVQQRLSSWPGEISPILYGVILIVLAIIFIPIGTVTLDDAENVSIKEKFSFKINNLILIVFL